MMAPPGVRRIDAVFLLMLVVALHFRVDLATIKTFVHDEANTSIPLSRSISFEPGNLHLPLRGENHGALPAYVVKASSTLFGSSRLGLRGLHILLSLCTVVMIYLLGRQWRGLVAARWAAALFALNEYVLAVSSRATAHVPHLFFATGAIYAFSRFLFAEQPRYLYAAGASLGLAFYCKEHSALLLPIFLASLLQTRYRHWLRGPHAYLACLLFALIIAPDLVWNATRGQQATRIAYGTGAAEYTNYQRHLQRIGGFGFSPYPAMFYARDAVKSLYRGATGAEPVDETPEYPSVNSWLGLLLLAGVVATTIQRAAPDPVRWFLLLAFWGIFGFFTLIKKGDPPGRLDPVSWIWVEVTLIPAVVMAGARLADFSGRLRSAAWAATAAALLYGVVRLYS